MLGSLVFPGVIPSLIVTVVLAAGLLSSLPAIATGLGELSKLGDLADPAVEKILWWHIGTVVAAVSLFITALLTHIQDEIVWTLVLTSAGTLVLVVGGHLGGKLVYEHRVGVAAGAGHASGGAHVQPPGGGPIS